MLKKTVTYVDFNDNERTETLHFHLSQTELVEMALDLPENVTDAVSGNTNEVDNEAVAKLMETLGGKGIVDFIKKLLMKSYGVVAEDGRRFQKSEELSKEFSETPAFDAIFMELMSDPDGATKFVTSVIPKSAAEKIPNVTALPGTPTN